MFKATVKDILNLQPLAGGGARLDLDELPHEFYRNRHGVELQRNNTFLPAISTQNAVYFIADYVVIVYLNSKNGFRRKKYDILLVLVHHIVSYLHIVL